MVLTTTYRRDYTKPTSSKPRSSGEPLPLEHGEDDKCKKICDCDKKYPLTKSLPLAERTNVSSEWTGIAPMGKLLDPRIVPSQPDDKSGPLHRPQADCTIDQPNRFLKILRTCYPELYERLNKMQDSELKRRLNVERLKSTYQIDYCHIDEYPDGLYKSLETGNDDKIRDMDMMDGCLQVKPNEKCEKCMTSKEECIKTNTPPKSSWRAGPSCKCRPQDCVHKEEGPVKLTEYMDTFSRLGTIMRRHDMLNHSFCRLKKKCYHHMLDD